MKDIYAILDIGSSTIKLLVGEAVSANINVLFSKKIPSHGVKKGIIEDQQAVTRDIRLLLDAAEKELESKITSVALNIPTIRARLYQSDSSISLKEGTKITIEDVERVLRLSSHFERSSQEEVVSVIPVKYHSDRGATAEPPIGQVSRNLIVDSLVITTNKKVIYPYMIAVEKAGVEILEICVNAFSCAKEAFDEVYLQEGALLIDIGYKTSTISFYKDGYLKYLTVCPVGGYNFTKKISQEFQISMAQAETYKIKYGSLDSTLGQQDIIHTTYLQENRRDYTQEDLANILRETAYEIMEAIKEKVFIVDDGHKYETLLVGGGGELEMLDDIASEVLQSPVRIYRPDTIGVRDMAFVSSLGMIYYLIERTKILGKYTPSLVLPDVTNTMSIRFKGLTKASGKSGKKINKFMDTFFSED